MGLGIIRPRPKLMSAIAMERKKPVTVTELARMKKSEEPISCLTVYDYSFASMMDKAGVEVLLVGDSLGMVIQGHTTTLPVTVDEVIYHTRSVARGTQTALIMADMPFGSFQKSPQDAFANASRLLGEGGAHGKDRGRYPHVRDRGIFSGARYSGLWPYWAHSAGGESVGDSRPKAATKVPLRVCARMR